MDISGKTALVVGANGGIGGAYVQVLLERGAARIYAADLETGNLDLLDDPRVVVLALDVTDDDQIAAARVQVERVDLLINSAGVLTLVDTFSGDIDLVEHELQVNYLGPLRTIRAFLPLLVESGGAVVNMLSVAALASMPSVASYSSSKAAAHSMTQALRAKLATTRVTVHGVFPGPVATNMTRHLPELEGSPKALPLDVARAVLDAVEAGEEDIFPDPMARSVSELWRSDPTLVEQRFAEF